MPGLKTLSSLLAIAGLAATASCAVVQPRQQEGCTSWGRGEFAVVPKGSKSPVTYIGVVDGVKHRGIDGKPASILVTKDDNGNALAPQRWDFDRCLGHAGQTYPKDGVMFPDGAINSIVDSVCDDVPEQYRTWLQDSSPNEKFQYLTYANGNNRVYISDTAHAELVLTDKADFHGKQEMQIVLIHSH